MNILILGSTQAEYEFVQRASQADKIHTIFICSDSEQFLSIAKTQRLICEEAKSMTQIMNENKIHLCINDVENCQDLLDGLLSAKLNEGVVSPPNDAENLPLSYAHSGVSIDKGNEFVEQISLLVKQTYRPEMITSLGGFSGAFDIPKYYQSPLLVAATDGVGTKLKVAVELQQHQTIGIDLVAMCVNDLIVCGAEPLFFLDYYATSKLDNAVASQVVAGICRGCEIAGCSLIGGETAEMPGIYQENDYDLAGFSVGMVERDQVIDGSSISRGDVVIGLPSSGIHSNGYSLVREVIKRQNADLQQIIAEKTLAEWLLTPTQIYVKEILNLRSALPMGAIKGLAHITGGGLVENIPRVLPDDVSVKIDASSWVAPAIFPWLQAQGNIAEDEMWRVFNMGIGMVVIVSLEHAPTVLEHLNHLNAVQIGVVEEGEFTQQCTIV